MYIWIAAHTTLGLGCGFEEGHGVPLNTSVTSHARSAIATLPPSTCTSPTKNSTMGRWGDTVCFGGACGVGSRRRRNKGAERAVRTILFYVCTTGWSCKMFARLGEAGIYFSYQYKIITTYIFTVQGVNRHRNFVGNTAEGS